MHSFNKIATRPACEGANQLIDRIVAVRPDLADASFVVPKYGRTSITVMTVDEVFKGARNLAWPDEISRECVLLQSLAGSDLGVQVPKVSMVAPDGSFYAMERLRATPLTPERLETLPPEEQRAIATRIGAFNARLSHYGTGDRIAPSAVTPERLAQLFAQDDFWAETGCDLRVLDRLENHLRAHPLMSPMLLHGDLHGGNILYNAKTKELSLIDLGGGEAVPPQHAFAILRFYYASTFTQTELESFEQQSGITITQADLSLYASLQELLSIVEMPPRMAATFWKDRLRPSLVSTLDQLEIQASTAQPMAAKPWACR